MTRAAQTGASDVDRLCHVIKSRERKQCLDGSNGSHNPFGTRQPVLREEFAQLLREDQSPDSGSGVI